MLKETINAWLNAPDEYQQGLALLRETGFGTGPSHRFTLTILSKGEDAYNRTRLESELRKWLGQHSVEAQKNILIIDDAGGSYSKDNSVSDSPKIPTRRGDARSGLTNAAPAPDAIPKKQSSADEPAGPSSPGVNAIRQQIYSLMDSRAEAKAAIRAMEMLGNEDAACEARKPYAWQVKQSTRQIDELYSRLDFFEQNGYLPLADDPAVVVDDTAALLNMRSYVSRYKGKLTSKKLTSEQRQAYETLLKQYSQEKQRLELKLKPKNDSHSTGQQTATADRTDRPIHHSALSRSSENMNPSFAFNSLSNQLDV